MDRIIKRASDCDEIVRPFCLLNDVALTGAFENYFSDGVFGGMRDGEVRSGCSRLFEEFAHESVKEKQGRTGRVRCDFDVLPTDAARPACSQSLERRFFCREACGIMLCGDCSATVAIGAFGHSVNALDEAGRALDDFTHAADFDNVYSNGNNHGRNGNLAQRRILLARG